MKRSIGIWQLVGFAVSTLLGTLLHFLYEWTSSPLAAPFSGVNESTWEHMKLLFWPLFIFAVVESFFFRDYESFWGTKLCGTLLGITLIPVIFYTYNGVIGKSPDWVNIAIFFISAAVAYIYEFQKLSSGTRALVPKKYAIPSFIVIALLFVIFSFNPPSLAIFIDTTKA
jgi:hypothetical protein